MTVVFIDPIHGAALTAGLLPILPALPCPTCGGSGGSLGPNEWQGWRPCPDCNGSGVWTPPDSPVPIGVTSALPEEWAKFGDFTIRLYDDGMWRLDNLMGDDLSRVHPIVLSSVIGEGMLRKLKVVEREWIEGGFIGTSEDVVATMPVDHPAYPALHLWLNGEFARDISSALPFLPGLKPEDTVYLLDGFTGPANHDRDHDFRFPKSDPKRP